VKPPVISIVVSRMLSGLDPSSTLRSGMARTLDAG
jgi:hypothetical protein